MNDVLVHAKHFSQVEYPPVFHFLHPPFSAGHVLSTLNFERSSVFLFSQPKPLFAFRYINESQQPWGKYFNKESTNFLCIVHFLQHTEINSYKSLYVHRYKLKSSQLPRNWSFLREPVLKHVSRVLITKELKIILIFLSIKADLIQLQILNHRQS